MDFQRVTSVGSPHFARCWQIYNDSFPREERRELAQQCAVLAEDRYRFVAVVDGGECLGLLCYWLFGADMLFVEHVATDSALRGRGVGAAVMEYVKSWGVDVILEIEPVVDELSGRRRAFYERLGFVKNDVAHRQPPFREGDDWLPLHIMSHPAPFTAERYEFFRTSQIEVQGAHLVV
ncbi:MAG: GNAT family N-acetyltransferase [Rikenellaceae bacterium]